jgi:hypothetical protein
MDCRVKPGNDEISEFPRRIGVRVLPTTTHENRFAPCN